MNIKDLLVDIHYADLIQAWQMIEAADKITLLTHFNPDGDGVSACAVFDHILINMGKKVETIYPTKLKTEIKRQPRKVLINTHEQIPDLIIICDTANYSRLYYPEDFSGIPSINIDHHVSSSITPTINFVDPHAASTCDYLYRLLMVLNPDLVDSYVANCLMYGVLYDTQNFSISSTTSMILRIGADLIDRGAEHYQLVQELMYRKSKDAIKIWGQALQGIEFNKAKTTAWTVIRQKDLKALGLTSESFAGFENFIAQLAAAQVTILFYEDEAGKSRASFRSKGIDVNAVAQKFGGGGHKFAAGLMSSEPLDTLVPKVIACFDV